jgi:hypothetical protein
MDIVVPQGVPFHAIQGKAGVPVVEAHGLGPLLAGKQAKGKAKAKQSGSSGRHRKKKFFIKVMVIRP